MSEFDEKDLRQIKMTLVEIGLENMREEGLLDYFVENEMKELEPREEYIRRGWIVERDYE
jgi:hypothetical protein